MKEVWRKTTQDKERERGCNKMTCACTLCVICNLYMLITQELCEGPAESAHMKVYGGAQTTYIVIWKWSSPCNLLLNISTILQEVHTYKYDFT